MPILNCKVNRGICPFQVNGTCDNGNEGKERTIINEDGRCSIFIKLWEEQEKERCKGHTPTP